MPGSHRVEGDMTAGAADFDFLIGSWHVRNERLVERLSGSDEWTGFEASASCRKIIGGAGNMDEMTVADTAFVGMSLRIFDPQTELWSIYWADNDRHRLLPPMVGAFADGKGVFYGDEEHQGRTVRARFIWTPTHDGPRWEQAFSDDDGATWETNWVMSFSRTTPET